MVSMYFGGEEYRDRLLVGKQTHECEIWCCDFPFDGDSGCVIWCAWYKLLWSLLSTIWFDGRDWIGNWIGILDGSNVITVGMFGK